MKNVFILLLVCVSLALSGQTKSDRSVIAIIPVSSAQNFVPSTRIQAEIESQDYETVEKILIECIDAYNSEQEKEFYDLRLKHPEFELRKDNFVIDLRNYRRQYIVVTNSNGEKEVWINCFCETSTNWKEELVIVNDGGNCYFSLTINLKTGKHSSLIVNGDA